MAKLIAYQGTDSRQPADLTLLSGFNKMKIVDRSSTTMNAIDQDANANFQMTGKGFVFQNKKPIAGVVQTIETQIDNASEYQLKRLSIDANKIDNFFKGNITKVMKKIFSQDDKLNGSGDGDILYSYNRADTINGNNGDDQINGGKGSDILNGGSGNDAISGGKGHDQLNGGGGSDQLNGGTSSDVLNGNGGSNTLTGGGGNDTFVFNTALNGHIDTITDMAPGQDTIQLSKSVFTALPSKGVLPSSAFETGSEATNPNVRIVYDPSNGNTYYDPDGNGSTEQTMFASLSPGLALSNHDFFVIG